MKLAWSRRAWSDYVWWQTADRKKLKRIHALIEATLRDPTGGVGNPEPLKHELQGYWSRRIDREHRLVYKHNGEELLIVGCRYHY